MSWTPSWSQYGPGLTAELGDARRRSGNPGSFDEAVRDVDPEAVRAAIEPEPQDRLELGSDLRLRPVEIGLLRREQVQVPLAGPSVRLDHSGPGRATEDARPIGRGQIADTTAPVAEHVEIALAAARAGGQRRLEPRMPVGRVVRDDIEQHPDTQGVRVVR